MKTEYQYLVFVQQPSNGKTSIWSCQNKHYGEELGIVKWFGSWRQYCYFPTVPATYSTGCLQDISSFIEQLKGEQK